MTVHDHSPDGSETAVRVIALSEAQGERATWGKPALFVYLWAMCELVFVTNPWQISSKLRVGVLRLFGAEIESGVVFRPRTRVKFPWKLHIGANSWIGEGVWIHNQDHVFVSHDVVISQETLLTTGSHRVRTDMSLITRPIHIDAGVWITSRCLITGGAKIGRSSLVRPMSVVSAEFGSNQVIGGNPASVLGDRFPDQSG